MALNFLKTALYKNSIEEVAGKVLEESQDLSSVGDMETAIIHQKKLILLNKCQLSNQTKKKLTEEFHKATMQVRVA